ncbi:unnamed protein product [Laminaria digitata]
MSDLANMLMSDGDDAVSAGGTNDVDIEKFGGMRAPPLAAAPPPTPAAAAAAAGRGRGIVMGRVDGARRRGRGGGNAENVAKLSRMRAQLVAARGRGFDSGRGGGREQKGRDAKRTNYTNLSPNATVQRRDSGRGGSSRGRMGTRGGRGVLMNARGRGGRGRGPENPG